MTAAIFPGSFDPPTVGHIDVIRRAARVFDKLIVVVMVNSFKESRFSAPGRVDMLRRSVSDIPGVEVDFFEGLLTEYAELKGAGVVVKGIRMPSDFDIEYQMALINRAINGIETFMLPSSSENIYISSSLVREIGSRGGDISKFVPECVADEIYSALSKKR